MEILISYNKFKDLTRHKKVNYTFFPSKECKDIKSFETDKFYCNKDSRIKIYSMPKFNLGLEGNFFQVTEHKYYYLSSYGKTVFVVQEVI